MARQVFGIVPDTPDERGSPSRQPGQPQEVKPRHARNAALMHRAAPVIEGVDLHPAEIEGIARRPDDRVDAGRLPGSAPARDWSRSPDRPPTCAPRAPRAGRGHSSPHRHRQRPEPRGSSHRPSAILRARSGAKCITPSSKDSARPSSVIPRAARRRKSTVCPPWAPLTEIVTCSMPGSTALASHWPSAPSHQTKSLPR